MKRLGFGSRAVARRGDVRGDRLAHGANPAGRAATGASGNHPGVIQRPSSSACCAASRRKSRRSRSAWTRSRARRRSRTRAPSCAAARTCGWYARDFLPVGGGFDALVDHATRLERLYRGLSSDLELERKLAIERRKLSEKLDALRSRRAPLEAEQRLLADAEVAVMAAEERKLAFDSAFNLSGDGAHAAVYGAAPGPSDPSDQASGFASLRGRLPFPITGRSEIRSARRASFGRSRSRDESSCRHRGACGFCRSGRVRRQLRRLRQHRDRGSRRASLHGLCQPRYSRSESWRRGEGRRTPRLRGRKPFRHSISRCASAKTR